MVNMKLYVEGGGDSKSLRTACRRGFRRFLEKAGLTGMMPRIVACGGRQSAYENFTVAHEQPDDVSYLLVDAEGPVHKENPWEHLEKRDHWVRPPGATDAQCHLMVQAMESWFLADPETLLVFYGQHFNENAIPANQQIERVSKADVFRGLERATRHTKKGPYKKGSHSFEILAALNPDRVENVSPHAKRFLASLRGQDT
jgi:hypothetical protein